MADRLSPEEAWTRALQAQLRYYEAMGALTVDYVKAVVAILGETKLTLPLQLGKARGSSPASARPPGLGPAEDPHAGAGGHQHHDSTHAPARPASAPPAMVLEATAGDRALGAFLVENKLDHSVSAPVAATDFVAPGGKEVKADIVFDPEVVTLEPNEQMLVRVVAGIDESLDPDVGYRGEVRVPGLSDTAVALVIRRRSDGDGAGDGGVPRVAKAARVAKVAKRSASGSNRTAAARGGRASTATAADRGGRASTATPAGARGRTSTAGAKTGRGRRRPTR